MSKLPGVALERLVNKARGEKLAVGMGTRLFSVVELLNVTHSATPPLFLWYIMLKQTIQNPAGLDHGWLI